MADALPGFDEHFAPQPKTATQQTTGAPTDAPAQSSANPGALPGFDQHFAPSPNTPPATTTQPGAPGYLNSTSATVDPDASDPSRGFDVGPFHFGFTNRGTPGVSYPGSQTVHDISNRMTNDVTLNTADPTTSALTGQDLATLRAQRAQADQRMSTGAKLTADIGGAFNPAMLGNVVPGVGGGVQGAAQEGVKGYAGGESWPSIASDAVKGGLAGLIGQGMTSPQVMSHLLSKGVTTGVPAGLGYLWGGDFEHTLGGAFAGKEILEPLADKIKEWGADATIPNAAKQAVKNLVIGAGSTLTQAARDNQAPQPGSFGYLGY